MNGDAPVDPDKGPFIKCGALNTICGMLCPPVDGRCVPEYLVEKAQRDLLLANPNCKMGEVCAPCVNPLDNMPTGACPEIAAERRDQCLSSGRRACLAFDDGARGLRGRGQRGSERTRRPRSKLQRRHLPLHRRGLRLLRGKLRYRLHGRGLRLELQRRRMPDRLQRKHGLRDEL